MVFHLMENVHNRNVIIKGMHPLLLSQHGLNLHHVSEVPFIIADYVGVQMTSNKQEKEGKLKRRKQSTKE